MAGRDVFVQALLLADGLFPLLHALPVGLPEVLGPLERHRVGEEVYAPPSLSPGEEEGRAEGGGGGEAAAVADVHVEVARAARGRAEVKGQLLKEASCESFPGINTVCVFLPQCLRP